jgi:nitrate reductase NapE component
LVAIAVSLPELVHLDTKASFLPMPSVYFTQCVAHWNETQETAYQIFVLYAFYVVPICTMVGLYGQIVYTLWWRALPPGTSGGPRALARHGSVPLQVIRLLAKSFSIFNFVKLQFLN